MGSLARRGALAVSIACAPESATPADERLPLFRSPWDDGVVAARTTATCTYAATTPFDMAVFNGLDRFHLVSDVAERVPKLAARAASLKQAHARPAGRARPVPPKARRGRARDPQLALALLIHRGKPRE